MIAAFALLAAWPDDVAAYVRRYGGCIQWVGEDLYDPARAREIQAEVGALACDRLDADGAALRRRYRDRPDVVARLDRLRTLD